MESRASARYVRIAPSKVRQVMDEIRGKGLGEALQLLQFTPKRAARILSKVVRSAAANAENNHNLNVDQLYVARAYVDEGPTMKRIRPRARMTADRIRKRTSHITVVLAERK